MVHDWSTFSSSNWVSDDNVVIAIPHRSAYRGEATLDDLDVASIKLLLLLFDYKRKVFHRDKQGRLYACRNPRDPGVEINKNLLGCLPRGMYMDVAQLLCTVADKSTSSEM